VPAKTPPAVIAKFNGEANKILALPEVQAAATKVGITLVGGAAEVLDSLVRREIQQWSKVVQQAKIKPE